MEIVTRPHAKNLVRWAKQRPKVLVLSADLTSSCEADDFREAYPDRFFSMGMAEQNMMGFAAGLAREGFTPLVHTFGVFICRRPFDQVAMSIAYPNLPVKLFGFLPGITTPGGATHQATDDIALMRVLPNMTVLECGDATDVESVLDVANDINGPVYVRMLRGQIPRIFPSADKMELNRARVISTGKDIALLTSGICTEESLRVTNLLDKKGVSVSHLHVSTLKPFTDPTVVEKISRAKFGTIVMENHSTIGGLGTAVAETMAEHAIGKPLVKLGIKDTYAHGASRPFLMKEYQIDAHTLLNAAEGLMKTELGFTKHELDKLNDLQLAKTRSVSPEAKAEDL